MTNNQNADMTFVFPEEKVVKESLEIDALIAIHLFLNMFRMGGGSKNRKTKFLVKIVSK